MNGDMIIILDFGGTQSQSLARKVRGGRVYCEVLPYNIDIEAIREKAPKGIILAGGKEEGLICGPTCDMAICELGVPVLAVGRCSRMLLLQVGGRSLGVVVESKTVEITFADSPLFASLTSSERFIDRMDNIELPEGYARIAQGEGLTAAFADEGRKIYGMQFTAEQNDPDGLTVLANFTRGICGCEPWWSMDAFIERTVDRIRAQVGSGSALMAISGGVDSSVCAALMHKAIGRRMHCVYVDTGLMRKDESEAVMKLFSEQMDMEMVRVDAKDRFLGKLKGVTDPERKRVIIGEEFVRVFEDEAKKLSDVKFMVQGTIYPDVIESYGVDGTMIKSHHNVGGLPLQIEFDSVVEPLRELFKDEVREVGEALGLPVEVVHRQPFPGPGLAVRCMGEVTEEKLNTLREADAIFREEIKAAGLDRKIWQYFAVLTGIRTTGIRAEARAYDYVLALRAVNSIDALSASAYRLPYDLLERVVGRITTEVDGVTRVVYDITGKPPGTIEWE